MSYIVLKEDHIIVKEIEKRKNLIDRADEKRRLATEMRAKLELLEFEVRQADENKVGLQAEIDELVDSALLLGLIEEQREQAEPVEIATVVEENGTY